MFLSKLKSMKRQTSQMHINDMDTPTFDLDNDEDWSIPDWSREQPRCIWDFGRKILAAIRSCQAIGETKNPLRVLLKKWCILRFHFWATVTGTDIPLNTKFIGGGLLLPHPNGIVIHSDVIIGPNCLIFLQVTLTNGVPLGYHVDIGAGAKVLGPVTIGNNVRIGSNAVVTKNIASGCTVTGIPAKSL